MMKLKNPVIKKVDEKEISKLIKKKYPNTWKKSVTYDGHVSYGHNTILINKNLPKRKQEFVKWHEIGHIIFNKRDRYLTFKTLKEIEATNTYKSFSKTNYYSKKKLHVEVLCEVYAGYKTKRISLVALRKHYPNIYKTFKKIFLNNA